MQQSNRIDKIITFDPPRKKIPNHRVVIRQMSTNVPILSGEISGNKRIVNHGMSIDRLDSQSLGDMPEDFVDLH